MRPVPTAALHQRRGLLLAGGGACVVALAWCAAVVAVPPPAPALTVPPRQAVPAAVAAGTPAPVADARETVSPPEPEPSATAARVLDLRVQRAFVGQHRHYIGPLEVAVAGGVSTAHELVHALALPVALPAGAGCVTFHAPGFEPATFDAAAHDAKRPASVVLQPRTHLLVVVRGLPVAGGEAWLDLDTGTSQGSVALAGVDAATCPPQSVPFEPAAGFTWRARWRAPGHHLELAGDQPAVACGEQRELVLDFASVPVQRHRIVGPSVLLLPHLEIVRTWSEGGIDRCDVLTPAADGTFTAVPRDGSRFTAGRMHTAFRVPLRSEQQGDCIVLSPEDPLLGIAFAARDGERVASTIYSADGATQSHRQDVHVVGRTSLPRGLRIGTGPAATAQPLDATVLAENGDFVVVPAIEAAEVPTGTLAVRVTNHAPDAAAAGPVQLVVAGPLLAKPATAAPAAEVPFELPAGGTYSVSWQLPQRRVPVAADVTVVAGRTIHLTAALPRWELWTGEVAGGDTLPPLERWGRVVWGPGEPFGSGMAPLLMGKTTFERCLLEGEPLDDSWRLLHGVSPVPAQITAIDHARRRFVLAPVAPVQSVAFVVEASGAWMLVHGRHLEVGPPWPFSQHDNRHPLRVAHGQQVHGALIGGRFDVGLRTLAWWSLPPGATRVAVAAAPGRWLDVHATTADENRGTVLVGPAGQWDFGFTVTPARPARVWVPEGKRSLAVFDGRDVPRSVREIPLGNEATLTID